jgi:hypothetical protein
MAKPVATATTPTVHLLAWVAEQSRSYAETIEAWKTSCPRLAVWEDALADHLVRIDRGRVLLTTAGKELLTAQPDRRCGAARPIDAVSK